MYVFLFRSNHAPQGNYYLVASDRYEAMSECELSGYMVYEKRVPLIQVAEILNEIPVTQGGYYESMAEAYVHSRPLACQSCVNRICGKPRGDVRHSMKHKYSKLTRYPGKAGEEKENED